MGYRVKSNRGIQFRIWANQILKKYLVKGYSLNELREQNDQLTSLKNTVNLLSNVLENKYYQDRTMVHHIPSFGLKN